MFRLLVLVCAVALPASHAIPVDPSSSPSGQISTFQQPSPVSFASSPSASMSPSVGMMQPTAVAGRVVEPVAFSAVRASDKSQKSNSKIFFDTTLSDIGFGWNSRSSEFICFYPGSYFFTFTAISDSGSHFKAALMKNSDEVVVAWGERVGYQSASNSVILNLDKNDRVYLNIKEGEIYETSKTGRGYTSFSGFRIY
ncbi:complement C1q tumor necrosis factor-related protein 4-like [Daphnia pulicaria]|uniref:complement C1q tumor necrosis factor-related protein 4-like n=1 Tax=Daphnia pulicaria TaxID=35523 RepID=UPI001EEBA327|nr:complement C1q tumor necrosis factor-related protein 4-like [Daphnia pulicaria]